MQLVFGFGFGFKRYDEFILKLSSAFSFIKKNCKVL